MFCDHCGKEIENETVFCPNCGNKIGNTSQANNQKVKVVLDPSEAMLPKKVSDSSQSFSGQGKTFGAILMVISIVGDLFAVFAIGFDAFIPITMGATVLFIIGFLMRMFCQ